MGIQCSRFHSRVGVILWHRGDKGSEKEGNNSEDSGKTHDEYDQLQSFTGVVGSEL
jgi:hypothetical protein